MTSKEALETIANIELYHREFDEDEDFDGDWKYLEYTEYDGLVREVYKQEIDTIKKDLAHLEVLEKENQELNDVIEKYNHLNIQSFFIRDREREEIKQLKKAIEIIKTFISVSNEVDFDTFITSNCDDEVINLLSEVLGE